jgi:hypothetical protein
LRRTSKWTKAALVLAGCSVPALMMAQSVVRCDSNGPRRVCRADTRGGIALRYQYSSQGCWQGDTWGYTDSTVWVSNGCKADFTLGAVPGPPAQAKSSGGDVLAGVLIGALAGAAISSAINNNDRRDDNWDGDYDYDGYRRRIRCESGDMGLNQCRIRDVRYAEVARQYSGSPCIYGRSWGYERNYIWVDRGCRADFWVR